MARQVIMHLSHIIASLPYIKECAHTHINVYTCIHVHVDVQCIYVCTNTCTIVNRSIETALLSLLLVPACTMHAICNARN